MNITETKKNKIQLGISQKLSILIITITFFPLLILGVSNYLHNHRTLKADSEKLLIQTATGMAGQANEWIDKNLRALVFLSKQHGVMSMKKEEQEYALKSFQEEFPWTYLVFSVDRNGMSLSRTDNGAPQNYADRGYFKEILAGKQFSFETLIGKTSKKPALVMAVPIKNGEETIGILAAAMNIDKLSSTIATWKNGETGFAFMVDGSNKVVSHPKSEFNLEQKNLGNDPLVKSARAGNLGSPVYFMNEAGKNALGVSVKVSNDWVLSVRQDESEIFSEIRRFQILAIAILLIATFLSMLMAIMAGRSITKPVLQLSDAANRMSLGEMDVRIEVNSTDEIGELASSISRLQASLKIAMQRLRK